VTESELWEEVKRRARACVHSDQAGQIVYLINNELHQDDAVWRDWHCKLHHWAGHGAVPHCPVCEGKR
jgi:hypothetical protein